MPTSRTYTYALSVIISLLTVCSIHAQNKKESNAEEKDTIQLFRGAAVSYDLAGTVMRMVSDYGQFEAGLHVNLRDKYFPVIELGLGSALHKTDIVTGVETKVNAPYCRLGCDFNVSKNKHDIYRVMVGARYGLTSFKTEASGNISDPYWRDALPYSVNIDKCFWHWAEFLFAVDAQIWGPVRLGWSVRYKMKIGSSNTGYDTPWYIPGYGKNGNKLGGTFNIKFELGRKNKKPRE